MRPKARLAVVAELHSAFVIQPSAVLEGGEWRTLDDFESIMIRDTVCCECQVAWPCRTASALGLTTQRKQSASQHGLRQRALTERNRK